MRHVYFRLILGLVFAGCLVYCGVTGNWAFALLYLVLGGLLLVSAYGQWKREKDRKDQGR